jgi:phosphoesterase RecJ-like protein
MTTRPEIQRIVDAIRARRRFVLSSHSRPDGDSIGSQLTMAYAHRARQGSDRRQRGPGAATLRATRRGGHPHRQTGRGDYDAAIVMECGDLAGPASTGRSRFFVINIDHHPGNSGYGESTGSTHRRPRAPDGLRRDSRAWRCRSQRRWRPHIYLAI